jgi:hypothetical protein
MRTILTAALTAAGLAAAFPAAASSLDEFHPTAGKRKSITVVECQSCPRAEAPKKRGPGLAPGAMIHELKEVDGQMMLYTTEAMRGGSPVTIVRKATDYDIARYGKGATATTATAHDMRVVKPFLADMADAPVPEAAIDTEAKTSSLAAAETPAPAGPAFDASGFTLRTTLN